VGAGHGHGVSASGRHVRRLWISLGVLLAFLVLEVVVGVATSSLALLSDFFGSDQKAKAMSEVFEAMRHCDDIVPMNIVGAVTERLTKPWEGEGPLDQMSFSTAARVMGVLVRKRLLANGTADIVAVAEQPAERRSGN